MSRVTLPVILSLVGLFAVSAIAGGLIALAVRPPPAPVSLVPSPTPSSGATPSPLPASPSPGPPATTPTTTPAPTDVPTIAPTATPVPPPTPSGPPVTSRPSVSPSLSPTPLAGPGPVEAFADELVAAIGGGRRAFLVGRLHPAVIDRYGPRACRSYVRAIAGSEIRWEILGSSEPAEWVYVTDQIDTVIPDASAVQVNQPGADPEQRELHFAPFDDTWRWFTDCGNPLPPTV